MFRRWRVKRAGSSFRLNLPDEERSLLRDLLPQLRELIATPPGDGDERIRRVFPTAYPDDAELDAEYQRFMREELVASHTAAIERVEASLDRNELSEGELLSWMQSLNSVRLVLGTLLDVSEDGIDADADDPGYALYGYLSALLEEMVHAIGT